MARDLARPAAGPPAKGLDAHRLAARVQHVAHQCEQVEGEHAQRGMQRVGMEVAARGMRRAEAAAKLADAVFGVVAPAAASADRPRVAPPAEARRQGPVDAAALRQGVAGLRAIELELLPAGLSPPLHHRRERFGRVVHRVQEPRRLLRLARRPVALDEGLPPRLVQRRGRIDVQGRPFAVVQRDRQQPAVRQRQGVQRAALRSAAPQPPAQGVVARQSADAEQLQQRPLLAQLRHSAQMPRALVHHQHERRQVRPRAQAAAAARLRHQSLEMGVEPQLADQLGERRQAASRSRFVFRGGNLAGLDVHKALLRSGPPNG